MGFLQTTGWYIVTTMSHTCLVDGCDRPRRGPEYCNLHRQRLLRTGELGEAQPKRNPGALCNIEDCERPARAKGMCKLHWRRFMTHGSVDAPTRSRKSDRPPCRLDGCEKRGRSPYEDICSMHYHREYRHGDGDRTAWDVRTKDGSVYRRVKIPGHPLARKNGDVWEHRVVLYNKVGPGPQLCHHCDRRILWFVADPQKNDPRLIQVDHLNNNRSDNRPDNLVPCCHRCNTRRAQAARHASLVEQGWWSNHDTVAQQGRSIKPGEF